MENILYTVQSKAKQLTQLLIYSSFQADTCQQDTIYNGMVWWRRFVILLNCVCLAINMATIIKKKQYLYNTLKIFLFLEFFSFIGQFIVLFHLQSFQGNKACLTELNMDQVNNIIVQDMLRSNTHRMAFCATQSYINLVCYNISYLFALLITLYVRKVLDNNHKHFMFKQKKNLFITISIICLVYAIPFCLSFFQQIPYSFGPVGFQIYDQVFAGNFKYYFFYCGITSRTQQLYGKVLSVLNMALVPLVMFIIHSVILKKNSDSIKYLKGLQQLDPRQWFILQSGNLSVFIFIIQSVNFLKYLLSIILPKGAVSVVLVGLLNIAFDFFPLILVGLYYKKYYKKGKQLQQKTIFDNSSLVSNDNMV